MKKYTSLLPYAGTPRQKEIVEACIDSTTQIDAAALLGINIRTLERSLERIRSTQSDAKLKDGEAFSGRVHCMIPDTQVTPDTPQDHFLWIAEYLKEIRPDVVVHIGDHADMESLSSYDAGKKAAEGRRVIHDIDAANVAMKKLTQPIIDCDDYNPELHITLGNHEHRINRVCESDAKLDGFLSVDNLNYKDLGWEVHDFLTEKEIDGVSYCHFFPNPMSGRPWGGMMQTMIKNIGYSFSMGHQQRHSHDRKPLGNGKIINGLVSGACYLHDEDYKGRGGNVHFRGIVIKNEVYDGNYDKMEVSLDYLCRKYEGVVLSTFMKNKYPDIFENSVWLNRLEARRTSKI